MEEIAFRSRENANRIQVLIDRNKPSEQSRSLLIKNITPVAFFAASVFSVAASLQAGKVSLAKENGSIAVKVDDKLFTKYVYKDDKRAKPVLYPIVGPFGLPMSRQFPLDEAAKGEAKDHPPMPPCGTPMEK